MSTPILTVAPAGIWTLDPIHSRVDFEVSYLAGTFKGEFHEIGAELAVEGERASLVGTAKVESVDVRDENLSAHLQSPDFFDAERHPELRFTTEDIRLDGDGRPGHRARALRWPQTDSALRRGRRHPSPPGQRRPPERGDRECRRGALCDPGVQLLDPRPAQERYRLCLAPGCNQRAPQQA